MNYTEVVEILSKPADITAGQATVLFTMVIISLTGVLLNCYLIWLIQTKLELATFINSLISFEVAFRLVECGVVEPLIISFEVCHWAPLPVYRLAHLVTRTTSSMSEFMCITPSVVNLSANLGIVIFNMLTNTVRSSYILSELRSIGTFLLVRRKWAENAVIFVGLAGSSCHLILNALTLETTDLLFASDCHNILATLRRPENSSSVPVKEAVWNSNSIYLKVQLILVIFYQVVSLTSLVFLAYVLYRDDKDKSMLRHNLDMLPTGAKRKRNLNTSIIGVAHFLMFVLEAFFQMAARDMLAFKMHWENWVLIQSFFMLVLHGLVSPGLMIWASNDAWRNSQAILKSLSGKVKNFIQTIKEPRRVENPLQVKQVKQVPLESNHHEGNGAQAATPPKGVTKMQALNPDPTTNSQLKENFEKPPVVKTIGTTDLARSCFQVYPRDPQPSPCLTKANRHGNFPKKSTEAFANEWDKISVVSVHYD